MSEAENAWRELQRRASESKFSGITATSDDLLADADLSEGAINPNAAAGGAGAGGPGGMMPPMMMGGMGGGGGGQAAGGSLGGLGSGGAAVPASGYAPGARYVPGAAPMKDQSGAGAGPMPAGGIPSGGLPGGGMPGGGDPGGGGGEDPVEEEALEDELDEDMPAGEPDEEQPDEEPEPEDETDDEPADEPADEPRGDCDGPEQRDGFSYEEERMAEIAELWSELSGHMEKMSTKMPAPASLGFAENVRFSTDELAGDTQRWSEQATKEFLLVSHQLMSAARAYTELEDAGVALVQKEEGLR